jgi:hypothetical protein
MRQAIDLAVRVAVDDPGDGVSEIVTYILLVDWQQNGLQKIELCNGLC